MRRWLPLAGILFGLGLTASGGYLASEALSQTGEPTRTVTIDVSTGPQGEPGPVGATGPAGPSGPAGGIECPAGFSLGDVVFVQPGEGPTTIRVCLKT